MNISCDLLCKLPILSFILAHSTCERTLAYGGGSFLPPREWHQVPKNCGGLHALHRRRFPCYPRYILTRLVRQTSVWLLLEYLWQRSYHGYGDCRMSDNPLPVFLYTVPQNSDYFLQSMPSFTKKTVSSGSFR